MQIFFEYGLANIEYRHKFVTLQGNEFTVYTSNVDTMRALETVAERLTNNDLAYESQSFYYKDVTTVPDNGFFEEEYIDLGAGDCIENCMRECCSCESVDLREVIDVYCNANNLFLRPEVCCIKNAYAVRLSASGNTDCAECETFESESEALRYACEQIELG